MTNKSPQKTFGKYFGECVLLMMTILWGATFVIVKESLNDISALLFVAFRFGIASAVLALIFIFCKKKFDKISILPGIFLGVLLFLGFFAQTVGLQYTSATKSGFITGTLVVMIPILQMIIEKKKPSRGSLVGIIIVFIGILFLSSGGSSIGSLLSELGTNFNFGDGLTLAGALVFAIHVVYLDIISNKYEFWTILLLQLLCVCIFSFVVAFISDGFSVESMHVSFTEYLSFGLLYTSLLATLLNIGLQTKFQKTVSPSKAGIVYSFEPIFASLFAFFLLNEKISNFGVIGCALIFLGLIVSEIFDSIFEKKNGNAEG